jgi:hypothetical protein
MGITPAKDEGCKIRCASPMVNPAVKIKPSEAGMAGKGSQMKQVGVESSFVDLFTTKGESLGQETWLGGGL